MVSLSTLDLSYNRLTGSVPHFGSNTNLRNIFLEHNRLSGDFGPQLTEFATYQDATALSSVHLAYNALSGPLPASLYDLKTNAHRITTIDVAGNHFRCDGDSGRWPGWVQRVADADTFGTCTRVPRVVSAGDASADGGRVLETGAVSLGGTLLVGGRDFEPSEQLACRLTPKPATTGAPGLPPLRLSAAFVSAEQVTCVLPDDADGGAVAAYRGVTVIVSVANYGDDFDDRVTHPDTYVPTEVRIRLVSPSPPPGYGEILTINNTANTVDAGAIAGGVVGGGALLLLCVCALGLVIYREKRGDPIFREFEPEPQTPGHQPAAPAALRVVSCTSATAGGGGDAYPSAVEMHEPSAAAAPLEEKV